MPSRCGVYASNAVAKVPVRPRRTGKHLIKKVKKGKKPQRHVILNQQAT